jgi:hypothetical protein
VSRDDPTAPLERTASGIHGRQAGGAHHEVAALGHRCRSASSEAAHALGDDELAADLLDRVAAAELEADERATIADDMARADELRVAITAPVDG